MTNGPWDRHDPVNIPAPCTATMLRLLSDQAFGDVLRSNLVPGNDRQSFDELWTLIAFNDDLAERCFDHLESWLESTDAALEVDPETPRAKKFRRMCDDAWNRLTKIRDLDIKQDRTTPGPQTTAAQFAMAITTHQTQLDNPTPLDDALAAALQFSRDRVRRSRDTTKLWQSAPAYTTQLIDAVAEHRRLNMARRPADETLYGLLQG